MSWYFNVRRHFSAWGELQTNCLIYASRSVMLANVWSLSEPSSVSDFPTTTFDHNRPSQQSTYFHFFLLKSFRG